jgi:hypothetical protein
MDDGREELPPHARDCLRNAIWPLETALKLSLWYPEHCRHLCGFDAEQRLFEVAGGKTIREFPQTEVIPF